MLEHRVNSAAWNWISRFLQRLPWVKIHGYDGSFQVERDVIRKGKVDLLFEAAAVAIQAITGPNAGILERSFDGSDWVEQDLFVEKNSFKLHLNRIYMTARRTRPGRGTHLERSNQ